MTRRRVVTSKRADDDIAHAVAYYVQAGTADAALGFIDALENASDLLVEHPSIGSPRFGVEVGIAELRGLALQRYPYIAFYTVDADAVRIHRVLHTSRDIPAQLLER